MIDRYSLSPMKELWSQENKYQKWLEVELAALEAWSEIGVVPAEAVKNIKSKCSFDLKRIVEIEQVVDHDVIAFVTCVAESVGDWGRYIHYGLTSYDVVDTALSLLMQEAADYLIGEAKELFNLLKERSFEFQDTLMPGRTHGVHAEPITFGLKLALWSFEMKRNVKRLERAKETISYGKLSGAVGTYAAIPPRVESYVCEKLGLKPAPASSQVLQRDRHADYLAQLTLVGCSIEKFAQEIRHLQRTEVLEVEEPFRKGQKGSSAMPHKKNPVLCERLCGLSRVLRGNLQAALENVALWHERDMSHSSVERIIIPDSTTLLFYLLQKFSEVIKEMKVNEAKMKSNLELTKGLLFSQQVLLALVEKGLSREQAYQLVQQNAMKTWEGEESFQHYLSQDEEVSSLISPAEMEKIFDYQNFLQNLKVVFERLQETTV